MSQVRILSPRPISHRDSIACDARSIAASAVSSAEKIMARVCSIRPCAMIVPLTPLAGTSVSAVMVLDSGADVQG
jgi:hypothetical protein